MPKASLVVNGCVLEGQRAEARRERSEYSQGSLEDPLVVVAWPLRSHQSYFLASYLELCVTLQVHTSGASIGTALVGSCNLKALHNVSSIVKVSNDLQHLVRNYYGPSPHKKRLASPLSYIPERWVMQFLSDLLLKRVYATSAILS